MLQVLHMKIVYFSQYSFLICKNRSADKLVAGTEDTSIEVKQAI